jgi:hypothetical protein
MTVTVKQVEAAMDKYEGLALFLAGVRSTMIELAEIGKKHYFRAEQLQAQVESLSEGPFITTAALPPDPRIKKLEARVELLVEAIESYTGYCPEFKTLEPCLSEDCLMFRRALAGLEKPE